MALTISERYVTNLGPLNMEVIKATTNTSSGTNETLVSNLSRVEGALVTSRDGTTTLTATAYVDGSSPNVIIRPTLTSNTNTKDLVIILFGY